MGDTDSQKDLTRCLLFYFALSWNNYLAGIFIVLFTYLGVSFLLNVAERTLSDEVLFLYRERFMRPQTVMLWANVVPCSR